MPERARQLHRLGRLAEAAEAYRAALHRQPGDVQLRHDHAVVLMQMGRFAEAVPELERVLAVAPGQTDSTTVLALCLRAMGRHEQALAAAGQVLAQRPDDAIALLVAGSARLRLGDARAAEPLLRRAGELEPGNTEAWHYLGEALQAQQRWREAALAWRRVLPTQPGAIANIALCAELAGDLAEARAGYLQACRLFPDRADCRLRLAHVEAMMCLFDARADSVSALDALLQRAAPAPPDDVPEAFALSYLEVSPTAALNGMRRYRARVERRAATLTALSPPQPVTARPRPIRLGYLSPDLGEHAVGRLLDGLFAAHDRRHVQVFGYGLKHHHGALGERLRDSFDRYHDCTAQATAEIAARIRADGIDVLIDLGGYTHGARPEILALRPAPVQLAWLGFIHGLDAPWLDGNLMDAQVLPEPARWPFREPPLRLPGTLFPAGPMPRGRPDRVRFGLPPDRFVFASFNNSYKLDRALLSAWLRILQAAPQADLLMYLPDYARDGFLDAWSRLGGARERLIVVDRLPFEQQADRAASCDLFLDAFRYQAGSTGVATLAAGLPLLSREGDTPLSRLGVSLNRFLGLDELVCADTDDYVRKAIALADPNGDLASVRQRLAQAVDTSGLTDPRRIAAALEALVQAAFVRATRPDPGPFPGHVRP